MEFNTFCREVFTSMSSRLPLHLQAETNLPNLVHQGGWHFPSAKDKDAYFFDLAKAYRHYIAGMHFNLIVDALEADFLRGQWGRLYAEEKVSPSPVSSPPLALRIRPREEAVLLPVSCYYLCWNQFILEPCLRRHPTQTYSSLLPENAPKACREEEVFWPYFWKKLVRQDPAVLFAITPPYQIKEIKLHAAKTRTTWQSPPPSYVLTSRKHHYGAAVLFYPAVLRRLHKFFSDYFLLMPSPHCLMLYPGSSPYLQDSLLLSLRQMRDTTAYHDNSFPPVLYQYTVARGLTSC